MGSSWTLPRGKVWDGLLLRLPWDVLVCSLWVLEVSVMIRVGVLKKNGLVF